MSGITAINPTLQTLPTLETQDQQTPKTPKIQYGKGQKQFPMPRPRFLGWSSPYLSGYSTPASVLSSLPRMTEVMKTPAGKTCGFSRRDKIRDFWELESKGLRMRVQGKADGAFWKRIWKWRRGYSQTWRVFENDGRPIRFVTGDDQIYGRHNSRTRSFHCLTLRGTMKRSKTCINSKVLGFVYLYES